MDKVHFSTGNDEWGTPQELFDGLQAEFSFTLDACASPFNHKCERYYDRIRDGLAQSWAGETVFCNPPYSRKTRDNPGQVAWVQKCFREARRHGIIVVMLLPVRTDTRLFHEYLLGEAELQFIWGQLCFEGCGVQRRALAPFSSMIAVYRGRRRERMAEA